MICEFKEYIIGIYHKNFVIFKNWLYKLMKNISMEYFKIIMVLVEIVISCE